MSVMRAAPKLLCRTSPTPRVPVPGLLSAPKDPPPAAPAGHDRPPRGRWRFVESWPRSRATSCRVSIGVLPSLRPTSAGLSAGMCRSLRSAACSTARSASSSPPRAITVAEAGLTSMRSSSTQTLPGPPTALTTWAQVNIQMSPPFERNTNPVPKLPLLVPVISTTESTISSGCWGKVLFPCLAIVKLRLVSASGSVSP